MIRGYKKDEGLKVFLKGSTPTITGVMVSSMFHLTCYQNLLYLLKYRFFKEENILETKSLDIFKIRMNKEDECCEIRECEQYTTYRKYLVMKLSALTGMAGLLSGIVLSIVTTPIDNVRIRLQSNENIRKDHSYIYESPRECMKDIIKNKGMGALYTAFPVCMLRESLASFIYFFSFEYLKNSDKVKNNLKSVPLYRMFIYGGMAGMLNWIFTLPIDCIKTKIISDTINKSKHYEGIIDCVRKTYVNNGIKGFFSGLSVVLIRACIVNGVVLSTFEKCRARLLK
jgi:solute carrier family 25 carnitine/acylcarnitine transporter 20/29